MIYIGNFLHVTNQEEDLEENRRHGEFNLIVQAQNMEEAIDKFGRSIHRYRKSSDFFQGDCTIYFVELLEFENLPGLEAQMLNYKSVAGDPLMPYIACSVPSDGTDGCRIINWERNEPAIEGHARKLFIDFQS